MSVTAESARSDAGTNQLQRAIDWKGAFWVASSVPPLVLFSLGGIAGTTGRVAFLVWIISMVMGFVQSFTYAEIAGMFSSKSGGASVYGATAWLRYSKFIAPLSVWCNWFAWSPVLSLGSAIAAGYIINMLAPLPVFTEQSAEVAAWLADPANPGKVPADAIAAVTAAATPALRTWSLISFPIPGLAQANINATFSSV
jgi:amino acid transporter